MLAGIFDGLFEGARCMQEYIKLESTELNIVDSTARVYGEKKLLANEIPGVITSRIFIKKGNKQSTEPCANKARVILFIKGRGAVTVSSRRYKIEEMAIFCPSLETAFIVEAKSSVIDYLEILTDLTPAESTNKHKIDEKLPYFLNYSECERYIEKIKSDKTINRTLLPPDIIPRLSIGSVETVGPDTVEAHKHPMLEQLFYGLPGNPLDGFF